MVDLSWWENLPAQGAGPKLANCLTSHDASSCHLWSLTTHFLSCLDTWTSRKTSEHFKSLPGLYPCKCKERISPRTLESRYSTSELWEMDFTEVKPGQYGYRYLLVFVNIITGWVEAFPSWMETAQVVAKKFIMEIIPRFDLPISLRSDNGPAFMTKLT